MANRIPKYISGIVGLFVFAAALLLLRHSLHEYHYSDILQHLRSIPLPHIYFAILLTLVNYLVLTGYDALAFQYIRHPLPYRKIAMASFIGYAFSQSLGLPVIMGGSVRYRLYSGWGLSAGEVAQVVAFSTVTFWLGIFALGGVALLIDPMSIPRTLNLPFATTRPIGLILTAFAAAYCAITIAKRTPFRLRQWQFVPPDFSISALQIVVSSFDWALAAAVLYVLLPPIADLTFPAFVAIFLSAQILGVFSQVPGGLGVFESIILLFLSSKVSPAALLSSLVAYRAIYYFLPLTLSMIVLSAHEVSRKWGSLKRVIVLLKHWLPQIAPTIFAFATFGAGIVLLFSGATPAAADRLQWLQKYLPLPLLEISHFLASLTGFGLLLLARGLQRRLDGAFVLTAVLFVVGLISSLLKGLDYEEATLMAALLIALVPCHTYFYRKASLINESFTRGWIIAILLALISTILLALFSYRHAPYADQFWWRFTFYGDAPRSLRAAVGACALAFAFGMTRLLRPASPDVDLPEKAELEKVKDVIAQSKKSYANLAMLGDKALLVSSTGRSFVMYGVEGRSWVAMGDPIGPDDEKAEMIWRFRELCDQHDGWTVFYEVDQNYLPLYLDVGLTLLKIGEEARIPLDRFTLDGKDRKTFRHLLNKFEKDGFTFEIIPPSELEQWLPVFKEISDQWLEQKNTREKGFSLGYFDPEYLKHFPAGLVRNGEKALAFINIWTSADKEELSLDLMRYLPDAPNGVMDYLFLNLIFWGKEQNYRWFNLGMSPLSGLQDRALAPLWSRIGALVFRHGEHFYNFQGLRQYKEKFDPVWEPKYLAAPGRLVIPRVLPNLGTLISGGLKGVLSR